MKGRVTKIHFFHVVRNFGWRKVIRLLLSRERTALQVLMGT